MKKLLRVFAIAVIWVAAAAAIQMWCIVPFSCNLATRIVLRRTENLAIAGPFVIGTRARRNLELIGPCFETDCSNPELAMLLADNYRLLGKPDVAVAILEKELRYERRPEIYCMLGLAQIEAGRPREGVQNLTTAVLYNPNYLDRISVYYDEVYGQLALHQVRIQKLRIQEAAKARH